jgi:hypothetical protein
MNFNLVKTWCIVLMLLCCNTYIYAQRDTGNTSITNSSGVPMITDSISANIEENPDMVIQKAVFNKSRDSILAWKRNPEFGYILFLDSLLKTNKNFLKVDTVNLANNRTRRPSANISRGNYSNNFFNSLPVKIFFWSLAIIFIAIVLYKLFLTGGLFEKRMDQYKKEPVKEEPKELSDYAAYNKYIGEAESKNDFNLATRYLYLQLLKKLSDKELILFTPEKTNNVYVTEVSGWNYQYEFSELTRNYEYVWYGKFAISISYYRQLKENFLSINNKF